MTDEYEVFSDGACRGNPGPGGWGTIVRHGGEEQELSGYDPSTTNNKMELLGAIEGLETVPVGASVTCTTDSNYVVKGMSSWITGWKRKGWRKADGKPVKNEDLWKRLDAVSSERTVTWKWVRGHDGHAENERCDALANDAIDRRGGL